MYEHQQQGSESRVHQVVKAATAAAAGGSLLMLSGLTLTATVIALTVATPVLVIFSPVLAPAVITVLVLVTGLFSSGGFGLAGVTVLAWMYRYVTGEGSTGAEQGRQMVRSKGRGRDDRGIGKGHHATGGVHLTTGARTGLFS